MEYQGPKPPIERPPFEIEKTRTDLREGFVRMKALVDQLRQRLDRRRNPRDPR